MKNFLQVNRASTGAKKNFNFNFKSLLVLSAVLLLGSVQVWGETVDCSGASATSGSGYTNKSTSTNYTVYFSRGGGGWSFNSGYGYQGKTDAIAVFELLVPTNVYVIVSNIDNSKARAVEVTAKPFKTVALGEEFLSILEVSYSKPAKYADCVSSSKNYAKVATTSAFYNTNHSTMCTLSNTQLSTSVSYSTGEKSIATNTTGVRYSLGILPAGVYAAGFTTAGNSNVTLAGFEFSPANPTFSVSADAELTAEEDAVTLTSAGNTIYYKWSTNSSAYAANAGATLAGATDGSGTSPVDATAPAGTGTYYLYAVAKNGTYYSDVVKRSYTIVAASSCTAPTAVYVTQTEGSADMIAGESFTLSAATSTGVEEGATYQWYRGSTEVGSDSPTFTVNSCTATDAGTYWCKITNPCSSDAHTTNVTGFGIKVWQVLLYKDSWNAYDLTSTGTKTGEVTRQLTPGTYYIKLTHNNGVDFGVNTGETISEITATTPSAWTLYNGQNNIKVTVTTAGEYTFGVDYSSADNPTLSVTYPPSTISSCDKIYFCPTVNSIATGSAKFSIYFYNATQNAWANCYLVDGTDFADDAKYVAYAPAPGGWTGMIVVRYNSYVSSWDNKWNQSQDITYNGYNYIVGTGYSDDNITTNLNSFYSSTTPAMDESEYCVIVGGTTTASTNLPSGAVTYTSSDETKATVGSTTGLITGVAAGTATITAKVGTCTVGTATVTVYAAPSVALSSSSVTYGGSAPTLTPSNFATVTGYSSSTTGTATINSSGVISIVAAGTTTFTVTGTDQCGNAVNVTTGTFTVNQATPNTYAFSADNTSICSGSNVTFTIANSQVGATYYVTKSSSGGSAIGESKAGTGSALSFTVSSATLGDYYCYTSATTNYSAAKVSSSKVTISYKTATSISSQPNGIADATVGEEQTLSVTAAGTNLSYQWQVSDTENGTYSNVASGGTSASYSVTPAAAGTKWYQVVVTGDCGTVTSNKVSIVAAAAKITPTVTWTTVPSTVYKGGKYAIEVSTNTDVSLVAGNLTCTNGTLSGVAVSDGVFTGYLEIATNASSAPTLTLTTSAGSTYAAKTETNDDIELGNCEGGGGSTIYSYTITSTSDVTGGSATGGSVDIQGLDGTATAIDEVDYYKIGGDFSTTKRHIKITLSGTTLAAGDVITLLDAVTGNNAGTFILYDSEGTARYTYGNISTKNVVTEQEYTVTAGDGLVGSSVFYIGRNGSSGRIRTITITRPGGGSSQTTNLTWSGGLVDEGSVDKTVGDANFTYTASSNNSNGAISYSSGTTSVATINSSTGEVTIVSAGSTTITATVAESGCYPTKSITYTLTVAADVSTYTLTATAVQNMIGTFSGSATITNSPVSSVASGTTIATSSNTFTVGSTTVTAPETIAGTVKVDDGGTPYNAPCTWRFSKWNNIVTPVAGDESDIEAEYVPTFAIKYELGEGETINEDYPTYYIFTDNEEDEISLPTNVTKANYTFDHWVDAWSNTRSKITCDYWGDFNLTAIWTAKTSPGSGTVSGTTSICSGDNTDITLSASVSGASYQLYKGEDKVGDAKAGTGSALTWSVSEVGTYTVKAVETATHASGDMSGSAVISASTATSISTQPTTAVAAEKGENFTLGTSMVATGQGDLSYQWYSYTTSGGAGEASIGSATSATYTTSKADAGTYYYKVEVTAACGSVKSNMITVTVSEPPCFIATNLVKNGNWFDIAADDVLDAANVKGTITGGAIVNSGSKSLGCNANDNGGLVFDENTKQITVYLNSCLAEGTVITLGASVTDKADKVEKTSGLSVAGNACTPATYTANSKFATFTQTYTVPAESPLIGKSSFTIALATSADKTYLKSISVSNCGSCTDITPSLSYSATTLYADGGTPRQARPTLTGNTGNGDITWVSSNSSAVSVNSSGVITAVGAGMAKISAIIDTKSSYCGGVATSSTITVPAFIQQTINLNSAWSTVPNMTFPGDPTSTLTKNANIAATGYTIDESDNKSSLSSKITGVPSSSSKNDSYYMSLKFNTPSYPVRLSGVTVKIQPIDKTASAVATISDGTTTVTSNEVEDMSKGSTKTCNFAITPTVFAAGSTITVKIFVYDQSEDKGFRLGSPILVNGAVLKDQKFTDANSTGLWSDPANWDGGSLPEIYHDVVIEKPVAVDIAHATAKSIVIYNNGSDKTGKLTIQPNKGLEVDGTIQKTTDGSTKTETGEADLVLESSSAGNASLIFNNSNSCAATVQMYSKGNIDGTTWKWQYVGTPFTGSIPLYNYYGSWMYKWNNGWEVVHGTDELNPFVGYCLTQQSPTTHVMGGTLVATDGNDQSVTMGVSTDMVLANSWTAPIYIGGFTAETFTSAPATIYLFNTGMAENGSEEYVSGDEAGTYVTVPVNAAEYTGNELIAPMQGFFVTTVGVGGSDGTITMKYDELVRPSDSRGIVAGSMKAPKRIEERPEVMKIRAEGSVYNDRVVILSREDFSQGFDNGWDGKKMSFGNASPSVYVINEEGGYDAVSAIPEYEGTVVGFRAGTDSEYTIRFEYDGEEMLYLNDLQEQEATPIDSMRTYTFTAEAGDNEARFIISATPVQKVTTGVDPASGGQDAKVRKVIINDHIYIIRGGRMYSVDGALVK